MPELAFYDFLASGGPSGENYRYRILNGSGTVLASQQPDFSVTPSGEGWVAKPGSSRIESADDFPFVDFFNDGSWPTTDVEEVQVGIDRSGGTSFERLFTDPTVSEQINQGDTFRIEATGLAVGAANIGLIHLIQNGGTASSPPYRMTLRDDTQSPFPASQNTNPTYGVLTGAPRMEVNNVPITIPNNSGSTWQNVSETLIEVEISSTWHSMFVPTLGPDFDMPSGSELDVDPIEHTFVYA